MFAGYANNGNIVIIIFLEYLPQFCKSDPYYTLWLNHLRMCPQTKNREGSLVLMPLGQVRQGQTNAHDSKVPYTSSPGMPPSRKSSEQAKPPTPEELIKTMEQQFTTFKVQIIMVVNMV